MDNQLHIIEGQGHQEQLQLLCQGEASSEDDLDISSSELVGAFGEVDQR